jgi:hypothetical protein
VPQIGFHKQFDGVHKAIALEWNGSNRKCSIWRTPLGCKCLTYKIFKKWKSISKWLKCWSISYMDSSRHLSYIANCLVVHEFIIHTMYIITCSSTWVSSSDMLWIAVDEEDEAYRIYLKQPLVCKVVVVEILNHLLLFKYTLILVGLLVERIMYNMSFD